MEKQILMEFMRNNCVGYENRLTGREIEAQTGISYKLVSKTFLENLDLNVVNCGGYFCPSRQDLKVLTRKIVNLKMDYHTLNERVNQIERIQFELSEEKLF